MKRLVVKWLCHGNRAMNSFSTEGQWPWRRVRQWQECVSRIYPVVDITPVERDAFKGRIDWRQISNLQISDLESVGQRVVRTERHVRAAVEDLLQINFQIAGEGAVEQCGRTAMTRPGEFAIYHSMRPYEMRFGGLFRQISIEMPSDLLRRGFGSFEACVSTTICGTSGPGRFVFDFVRSLAEEELPFEAQLASRLQSHFIDLLVTALAAVRTGEAPRRSVVGARTLANIKRHIADNLWDPELSPQSVAEAENISLRYLYLLFQHEEQPIARWIQNCRLDRCKAELESRSQCGRTVSDIAFAWGFSDSTHFSRAFRRRFGISPRECRRAVGGADL
jgi:AraC family transcriptional activator of tynA and feaB